MSMDSVHYLRPAMLPRSLAIVGASPRRESLGHLVYGNIMSAGFQGEVHAVNPRHRSIDGACGFPTSTLTATRNPAQADNGWTAARAQRSGHQPSIYQ